MAAVAIVGITQPLTYAIPMQLSATQLGDEVLVPLGKHERKGWIVSFEPDDFVPTKKKSETSNNQIEIFKVPPKKDAFKEILHSQPAFLPSQITLFNWMSEYYGVSLAEILNTAIPKRQTMRKVKRYKIAKQNEANNSLEALQKKAPLQALAIRTLLESSTSLEVSQFPGNSSSMRSALKSLETKGLIESSSCELSPNTQLVRSEYVNTPDQLTEGQQRAVDKLSKAIDSNAFSPFLLLGVTGSGKTEVYIQAIKQALLRGGTALLLVPEISLTPQLVDQLSTRLSEPLALLHSQVGVAERWHYWEGLRNGKYRVAIGARSALFAPLPDLRLIIIDEEHETSYKQSDGFRYHGRDVAVMRAKTEGCTLILGSATPSLESLANVQRKRYCLLELPKRVHQRPLPNIEIVDLLKVPLKSMPAPTISPQLQQALSETLAANQQAIILYNKRGFSSYMQCDTCGEAVCCPECSIALTFHKGKSILLCHYCSYQQPLPEACGFCRNPSTIQVEEENAKLPGELSHRGAGTERVIEDLATLFPQAKLARMDRDTVGAKDSYRRILDTMRDGSADILVGTQMIAKGHDLPGVTLVGIVDADVGLHVPDFRTSERVYQLVTQAAGRAGRGENSGRVLVQTRQASHPTIVATATGRFLAFARFQLEQREKLKYPPFGRLMRIVVSAEQQRTAISSAEELCARFNAWAKEHSAQISVLGPAPAPHQRLRGLYRWHILVKSNSASQLSRLASATHQWRKKEFSDSRIAVDVDPVEML